MNRSAIEAAVVEEFNKKHAIVRINQSYILTETKDVFGNPSFSLASWASFRNFYQDERVTLPNGRRLNKTEIWLKSADRRKYSGIIFDPNPNADPDKYNMWRGFSCSPKKGDAGLFWRHVKQNICDGSATRYEYVRKWLSLIFQEPQNIHTALVLCGSQGTGKNFFVENIGKLLGNHFVQVSGMNELLSTFNFHLKNGVLIHANEALWGASKRSLGLLKGMITDRLCMLEAKGKDKLVLKNYKHVIISSNEAFPVYIDSDDRRFLVLSISESHKEDYAYFRAIKEQLDDGGYEALLYDLLNEDVSTFEPRIIPWSNESFKLKMISSNSCGRFIYEALSAGYFDTSMAQLWTGTIPKCDLYHYYKEWCMLNGEVSMPNNTFSICLKKIFPTMRTSRLSIGNARIYAHILPSLSHAKEFFCKAYKANDKDIFSKD